MSAPSLFGLSNSNRDFSNKDDWGKNKFNLSFPASLVCWMGHKGLPLKYLKMQNGVLVHDWLDHSDFLGLPYNDPDLRFEFECQYSPFQKYVFGTLPRIDLVTTKGGNCLKGIEIKLGRVDTNVRHRG